MALLVAPARRSRSAAAAALLLARVSARGNVHRKSIASPRDLSQVLDLADQDEDEQLEPYAGGLCHFGDRFEVATTGRWISPGPAPGGAGGGAARRDYCPRILWFGRLPEAVQFPCGAVPAPAFACSFEKCRS